MICLRHDYGPPVEARPARSWAFGMWEDVTQILYVCARCGKVKVRCVVGHWTLEELAPVKRNWDAALAKLAEEGQCRHCNRTGPRGDA